MNRHVGASFTLSVLAVVFFAVILYEPEHARSPRPASNRPPSPPEATNTGPAPALTPGVPLTDAAPNPAPEPVAFGPPGPVPATAPAVASRGPAPPPRVSSTSARPQSAAGNTGQVVRVASSRQARTPSRRSAFTEVADGESLADVALRVYGTPEATSTLWRANRDIIDRRDASLVAGTLLRTP